MANIQAQNTISTHRAVHTDVPLMGLRSEYVNISMLSARTAAALRRIQDGKQLDDCDKRAISSSSTLLRSTASDIQNAGESLSSTAPSYSYRFNSVAVTLEATGVRRQTGECVSQLRKLADQLSEALAHEASDEIDTLIGIFSKLSRKTAGYGGSAGDSLLQFRSE